jgi:predicted short-subunit dehydrogenase-like oxidoreductase (DUF2520 family)
MENISVSIIGAGNLAWHLAPALDNAGFVVREIYARNKSQASDLIKRLYQAEFHPDLDFTDSPSDLFLVAVSDSAIEAVAAEIELPSGAIIAHTSASQPAGVLAHAVTDRFGVFYPLQTFTRGKKVDFQKVPILIESAETETLDVLKKVASSLSGKVQQADEYSRRAVHLAAVFACNFTNHMLKVAEDICEAHNYDLSVLYPLITETVDKALNMGPESAQTGPARRHDFRTLDRHLHLLSGNEELSEIYRLISQHISDTYSEE